MIINMLYDPKTKEEEMWDWKDIEIFYFVFQN